MMFCSQSIRQGVHSSGGQVKQVAARAHHIRDAGEAVLRAHQCLGFQAFVVVVVVSGGVDTTLDDAAGEIHDVVEHPAVLLRCLVWIIADDDERLAGGERRSGGRRGGSATPGRRSRISNSASSGRTSRLERCRLGGGASIDRS
nr:unnamed protein product [Digitaria exilis]